MIKKPEQNLFEMAYCTMCCNELGVDIDEAELYDSNGDGPYCETCYDDLPILEGD